MRSSSGLYVVMDAMNMWKTCGSSAQRQPTGWHQVKKQQQRYRQEMNITRPQVQQVGLQKDTTAAAQASLFLTTVKGDRYHVKLI